jgi:hypothetical protein
MLRLPLSIVLFGVLAAGCSSSSDAAAPNVRAGEIKGADVWTNGLVLNGPVSIAKGATVTIEAGAKITCADGASLYVDGTLAVSAASKHAKITCAGWNGIAVDQGGVLQADGLELENAQIAIALLDGAGESTFAHGVVAASPKPFGVSSGTKLTVTDSTVTPPKDAPPENAPGGSEIFGTFVGSKLDYDAGGYEGISAKQNGDVTITDSTFHGTANDLLSAYGAKHVKLSYSTFKGSHCGVHIQPSESFEIDHITSEDIFGITIYASGAGPNTIADSNFTGSAAWLDFQGDNGPITMTNVFTSGNEIMKGGPPPTVTTASSPIADAKPR